MEENERGVVQENKEEDEGSVGEQQQQQQQVWSWGAGTEGQLGTEKLQDEHKPCLLHSLQSFGRLSFLSCGGAHVIALTPGGKVLTWGRGTSGQLGHGDMANRLHPRIVEALQGFVITQASAGWNHSGFVSETGCLFTCGDGSFGQLGHGDYNSRCSPEKVSYFSSRHVEQIACGMRHSIVLVKDHLGNQVHGFGSGKRGQLGISSDRVKSASLPQIALGLGGVRIVRIFANGARSAALSVDGQLYLWGRGFSGATDMHIPKCLTTHLSFSQAALGWNHALVLTDDGNIFMLGSYGNGVLSGPEMKTRAIHLCEMGEDMWRIPELSGIKVLHIAAGAEHSALITDDGSVMIWGWGEHGQLGLGDTTDQSTPKLVSFGKRFAIAKQQHLVSTVYCGSGFTYTLRTPSLD